MNYRGYYWKRVRESFKYMIAAFFKGVVCNKHHSRW